MPDKNDIDSLLNQIFSGGTMKTKAVNSTTAKSQKPLANTKKAQVTSSSKSRAAREAEEYLNNLGSVNEKMNRTLQKQIEDLNRISQAAEEFQADYSIEKELDELNKNLEEDGLKDHEFVSTSTDMESACPKEKTTGSEMSAPDINKAFAGILDTAGSEIIGQEKFLKKLTLSFKRPFVTGTESGKPASVMIVNGKKGTGRHSAIKYVVTAMKREKVLASDYIAYIDLSAYSENNSSKLLIQDIFSVIENNAAVIVFENYEQCSKSAISMLANFARTGSIPLSSRYAKQKGMLVDVGTALVPDAVSSINANGQYLIFLTENKASKLQDAFGAGFMEDVSDICTTDEFTSEALTAIGASIFSKLAERCSKKLDFKLNDSPEVPAHFAGKLSRETGVCGISDYAEKCYSVLSDYKLEEGVDSLEFQAIVKDNVLVFTSGDITLSADKIVSSDELIDEVKSEMDSIVGLREVKDYILSLEENFKVSLLRKERGLKSASPSMHMIFTGNPGTGKTTIARIVSKYLKAIGVLSGGQLIEVTRADLVGRYVGHTAPLTKQVIESALGGVLFIDEAYSLYRGTDDSFGLEAIDTLVKGMEDNRENLLVILAGYSNEMEEFLTANSGLRSRFPNIIEFPDYTADELLSITKLTVSSKGYTLAEECDSPLLEYYERKQRENASENGNGRMARNLVEAAILNQSKRIIAEKSDNLEELILKDFDLM